MSLTRDDIIEIAALVNLDPDLCNAPDDQLLTLVWHEILHAYQVQRYVLAELPTDLFQRVVTDARMIRMILDAVSDLMLPADAVKPPPLTLADRLDR